MTFTPVTLILLVFSSAFISQAGAITTTTTEEAKNGEFDVLTLVFVLIFVISFIIVFCIICYLRNRTDNNRNFQRLLINPARDTETGQNQAIFSSINNETPTGDTRVRETYVVKDERVGVNPEKPILHGTFPRLIRENSDQNSFISSMVERRKKKTSSISILPRPIQVERFGFESFSLGEIIKQDEFSTQFKGEFQGQFVRFVKIKNVILEEEDLEAFEAYATDMSGHPHTFPVFGVAHENEDLFIFTALLDDFVTLQKFLRQEHRSFGMKYNILLQLANVYAHMHGFGVNVRHISVEDVYINSNGEVYVDFFTKYFFNPEIIRILAPASIQEQHFDEDTDFWSFGILIVEVLQGKKVWQGKTSAEITFAVCAEGDHPPLDPLWPAEIHDICGDCFTIGRENLAGALTMRDISQQIKGLTLSPRFENDVVN